MPIRKRHAVTDSMPTRRLPTWKLTILSGALVIVAGGCGEIAFINAGVLSFCAAAAIPVVLHLLFRRRARRVKFPPIRFIQKSKKATSRRFRLKHLMLLMVRILMIVLFVLIISRPYVKSQQKVVRGKAKVKAALILDNSFSMGYRDRKTLRLNEAKKLALQVLDSFDIGSEVAVMSTSEEGGSFTMDMERVRRQIGDLPLTARADSCWGALRRARTLLDAETPLPKEAYIFSDMTKNAWQTAETMEALQAVNWCVVDVGSDKDDNFSIEGVTLERRTIPINKLARINATIRGKGPASRVVGLYVDGEKRDQQEVNLEEGFGACRFNYLCRERGLHFGAVEIAGDDPLPIDNRRYFLLDIRPPAEVLCVCENEEEAFFLTNALDPTGDPKLRTVHPICIKPAELMATDLGGSQAIFLLNAARLNAEQAARIAQYVSDGGGVAIFVGSRTDLREFAPQDSEMAFASGMEIAESADGVSFQPGDYSHEILKPFRGGMNGDLTAPRFRKYLRPLPGALESRARTILPFASGSPALLERSVGRGKILCFTSSIAAGAADEWNDLAKNPCFVPFVHELLDYVARYREGPADVQVGETAPIHVPESAAKRQVQVTPPGQGATIQVPIDALTSFALFRETREPGGYVAAISSGEREEKRGFVVNVNPAESDLARIESENISAAMPGARIRFARNSEDLKRIEREMRVGRELGHLLLWPLLLLMLLELVMGNTFYKD